MAQIAIYVKRKKETKSQETRPEPSTNKAQAADLHLNGQNMRCKNKRRVKELNRLKNSRPKSTCGKNDWPKGC